MTKTMTMTETMTVTRGSGNVFADLGIANPDEAMLKAQIVTALRDIIKDKGLTQTAAADLIGAAQPDLSKLLRGQTSGFTLERLFKFLRVLGSDIEIKVSHSNRDEREGRLQLRVA
jgi:predicted XRE-type DNA-binding protein